MAWVAIYLAACVLVGVWAQSKGRSGVGMGALSLFISPLLGAAAVAVMRSGDQVERSAAEQGRSSAYRKCPHCAELVKREASKCRYCGSALHNIDGGSDEAATRRLAEALARRQAER